MKTFITCMRVSNLEEGMLDEAMESVESVGLPILIGRRLRAEAIWRKGRDT